MTNHFEFPRSKRNDEKPPIKKPGERSIYQDYTPPFPQYKIYQNKNISEGDRIAKTLELTVDKGFATTDKEKIAIVQYLIGKQLFAEQDTSNGKSLTEKERDYVLRYIFEKATKAGAKLSRNEEGFLENHMTNLIRKLQEKDDTPTQSQYGQLIHLVSFLQKRSSQSSKMKAACAAALKYFKTAKANYTPDGGYVHVDTAGKHIF